MTIAAVAPPQPQSIPRKANAEIDWDSYFRDEYIASPTSTTDAFLKLYQAEKARLRESTDLKRSWMKELRQIPGIGNLQVDGADLLVTPTDDFAGRAMSTLLNPEIDGYLVVISDPPAAVSTREALVFLRDLPGLEESCPPSVSGDSIQVTTVEGGPTTLYRTLMSQPRGLNGRIDFASLRSRQADSYWREQRGA